MRVAAVIKFLIDHCGMDSDLEVRDGQLVCRDQVVIGKPIRIRFYPRFSATPEGATYPGNYIPMIKAVRAFSGMGLVDTKTLLETVRVGGRDHVAITGRPDYLVDLMPFGFLEYADENDTPAGFKPCSEERYYEMLSKHPPVVSTAWGFLAGTGRAHYDGFSYTAFIRKETRDTITYYESLNRMTVGAFRNLTQGV